MDNLLLEWTLIQKVGSRIPERCCGCLSSVCTKKFKLDAITNAKWLVRKSSVPDVVDVLDPFLLKYLSWMK